MYYPLDDDVHRRILKAALEDKSELTAEEKRDVIQWNANMIKSAITDILSDNAIQNKFSEYEAYLIGECPFFMVVTEAISFKSKAGYRQMTEDEVYKYANKVISERISRIRGCLSGEL